jgi:ribosomal subunit interface protein
MEIVVRGRHIEVSDRFREHASQKLAKVERYDGKCHRIDVEVSQESNPRLSDQAVRVELTCRGKGPVIRAEAAADEKYAALDLAYGRLVERLRRAADRRHDHRRSQGRALTERLNAAEASRPPVEIAAEPSPSGSETSSGSASPSDSGSSSGSPSPSGSDERSDQGPLVVREKTHRAPSMTIDQALYEMEMVGHDFFLFHDAMTDSASVVYRRKGYDYGVLHLEVDGLADGMGTADATAS